MTQKTAWRIVLVLIGLTAAGVTALVAMTAMKRSTETGEALSWSKQAFIEPLSGPTFTLTDQTGEPFGSEELQGKIWVVSFIFTRCAGTCPEIVRETAALQKRLAAIDGLADVRLVSISVDPEHDTPEVLTAFLEQHGGNGQTWKLLTGQKDAIWQLIETGFFQSVVEAPDSPTMPITHTSNFMLVDGEGRLRGNYDALDESERAALLNDLRVLINESR